MQNKNFAFAIIIILFLSCSSDHEETATFKKFHIVAPEISGINFQNTIKNTTSLNILNYLYFYNGAGAAAADFNNDGLNDLYFTANQTQDGLYINQGHLKFKNTINSSGIDNKSNWTTGVSAVDINNDGLMDLYICKIGSYKTIEGHNLLYINQGVDKNNHPVFKEESKIYGLNFKGFSTQSAFFDYDLDGDLDLFLLNHSVYPNRNYGNGKKREQIDIESGDKLYKNDNGKFIDVTEASGIFQGNIGYGLGVSISDINNDGYPDIYVGNDFFENDYLYINNKNGTFSEINTTSENTLGHTSHYSMGNAISDINNDGFTDIVSVDMLPEDLKTYKTSGLEYNYQIYQNYIRNGYNYQFMQNTLHINNGNTSFSETAFASGIASTEWSWSPLIADFDNDGYKDIYITNGIMGATNDMDFINFIANDNIQKKINAGMESQDLDFIDKMPKKKVPNYFFKNNGNNTFINVSEKWNNPTPSYSNGAIYSDLDNDGDLDIVVNNINAPAFLLENKTDSLNHFLKLKFKGLANNRNGIGVRAIVYKEAQHLTQENYTTTGYLSAVAPELHFGLGNATSIDSIEIVWPSGKFQTLKNVLVNQNLTVLETEANGNYFNKKKSNKNFLKNIAPLFSFDHKDNATVAFNRDPLIPFARTNQGPDVSVGDINNDGLDDLFISGSKRYASRLLIQNVNGKFSERQNDLFSKEALSEDISHTFFDANNDGFKDLVVVSGGNEFKEGNALQPRLYYNKKGRFVRDSLQFKTIEINASKVEAVDFDNDGDLDLCIIADVLPRQFGITPQHYLLQNDGKGNFTDITNAFAPAFKNLGNVTDMQWIDIDSDGLKDLIAIGHWMPNTVFINSEKGLKKQKNNGLETSNGWNNVIKADDFDNDGDIDFVVGNWGKNTRLTASKKEPVILYSNDFDDNGSVEPIVTYFYKGEQTPFASKDELVKQMPFLNKKFLSYKDFAEATFQELFPKNKIQSAYKKYVYELASCYYENLGDSRFKKHNLPFKAQLSTVNDMLIQDFNKDGFKDLLLVGNNYEISTQLGRQDASHGVLLLNDTKGGFESVNNQNFDISGACRTIETLYISGTLYYIVTRNNNTPLFLKPIRE